MKILISLQYWNGDRNQADRLARLIADLEKTHNGRADFLFLPRFDCQLNLDTVNYVSRKFNVLTIGNVFRRREVGWPAGCNAAAFETFDFAFSRAQQHHPYKAVLLLEADACPLHPNWIGDLHWAIDNAHPAKIMGHHLPNGPKGFDGGHINGCCLVSGDFDTLYFLSRKIGGCTSAAGWDWVLAPKLQKFGWSDIPQIRSWWRKPSASTEELDEAARQGCALLHGVKDASVENYVRKKFLS